MFLFTFYVDLNIQGIFFYDQACIFYYVKNVHSSN